MLGFGTVSDFVTNPNVGTVIDQNEMLMIDKNTKNLEQKIPLSSRMRMNLIFRYMITISLLTMCIYVCMIGNNSKSILNPGTESESDNIDIKSSSFFESSNSSPYNPNLSVLNFLGLNDSVYSNANVSESEIQVENSYMSERDDRNSTNVSEIDNHTVTDKHISEIVEKVKVYPAVLKQVDPELHERVLCEIFKLIKTKDPSIKFKMDNLRMAIQKFVTSDSVKGRFVSEIDTVSDKHILEIVENESNLGFLDRNDRNNYTNVSEVDTDKHNDISEIVEKVKDDPAYLKQVDPELHERVLGEIFKLIENKDPSIKFEMGNLRIAIQQFVTSSVKGSWRFAMESVKNDGNYFDLFPTLCADKRLRLEWYNHVYGYLLRDYPMPYNSLSECVPETEKFIRIYNKDPIESWKVNIYDETQYTDDVLDPEILRASTRKELPISTTELTYFVSDLSKNWRKYHRENQLDLRLPNRNVNDVTVDQEHFISRLNSAFDSVYRNTNATQTDENLELKLQLPTSNYVVNSDHSCQKGLTHKTDFENAIRKNWTSFLLISKVYSSSLTESNLKEFEDVSLLALRECYKQDNSDEVFEYIPDIIRTKRDFFLKAVKINGLLLGSTFLPDFIRSKFAEDEKIVRAAAINNYRSLEFASWKLRSSRKFMTSLVEENHPEAGLSAIFAHPSVKGRTFMESAIKNNGCAWAAIEENNFVSRKKLSWNIELALLAVKSCPRMFLEFREELRADRDVALAAVEADGRLVGKVVEWLQNDETVVATAIKNWCSAALMLKTSVDDQNKLMNSSDKILSALTTCDRKSDPFAANEAFWYRRINENSLNIKMSDPFKMEIYDPECRSQLINSKITIIVDPSHFVAPQYYDTSNENDLVKELKTGNWRALAYASEDLRSKQEIMKTAMDFGKNERVWMYGSISLQRDKEFLISMIKKNPLLYNSINFFHDEIKHLRSDKEVIKTVVSQKLPDTNQADKDTGIRYIASNMLRVSIGFYPDVLLDTGDEWRQTLSIALSNYGDLYNVFADPKVQLSRFDEMPEGSLSKCQQLAGDRNLARIAFRESPEAVYENVKKYFPDFGSENYEEEKQILHDIAKTMPSKLPMLRKADFGDYKEICKIAIESDLDALKYCPSSVFPLTEEFMKSTLLKRPDLLKYMDEAKNNEEIIKYVLEKSDSCNSNAKFYDGGKTGTIKEIMLKYMSRHLKIKFTLK